MTLHGSGNFLGIFRTRQEKKFRSWFCCCSEVITNQDLNFFSDLGGKIPRKFPDPGKVIWTSLQSEYSWETSHLVEVQMTQGIEKRVTQRE